MQNAVQRHLQSSRQCPCGIPLVPYRQKHFASPSEETMWGFPLWMPEQQRSGNLRGVLHTQTKGGSRPKGRPGDATPMRAWQAREEEMAASPDRPGCRASSGSPGGSEIPCLLPGKPGAHNLWLLSFDFGLLWGVVACDFGLLGFSGTFCRHPRPPKPWRSFGNPRDKLS